MGLKLLVDSMTACSRFGGGVPGKQYALIQKDGIPIEQYIARTLDGRWRNSLGMTRVPQSSCQSRWAQLHCQRPKEGAGVGEDERRPSSP